MTQEEINANIEYLEKNDVQVHVWDGGYELESYTDAGGDMIVDLDELSRQELLNHMEDFDINNEVLMWWQNGEPGRGVPFNNIRDHYDDIEAWVEWLTEIAGKMPH